MRGQLNDSEFMYAWGFDELQKYTAQQGHRFYRAGLESFDEVTRALVEGHLQYNEGFIRKKTLRDLQVIHHQEIKAQKRLLSEAQARFDEADGERYARTQLEIKHSDAAIRGISSALERLGTDESKRSALEDKLIAAQERLERAEESLRRIYEGEGWSSLRAAQETHQTFLERVGITEAERAIRDYNQSKAKRSQHLGFSFEGEAVKCAHQLIIPQLIARREADRVHAEHLPALKRASIRVLTQVTLHAAQAELDVVIVHRSEDPKDAVTVLAVIEAKRNPDDLAEGFMIRRENIAWFSGDQSGYDTARYTNKMYPEGHFNRGVWHDEQTDQQRYYFDERSFRSLRRGDCCLEDHSDDLHDHCPEQLYFVTLARPLCDLPSGERAILDHYLATGHHFHALSGEAMKTLYEMMQSRRALNLSAYELIQRHYLRDAEAAQRIIMLHNAEFPIPTMD